MLEEKRYAAMDKVFLSIAAFLDRSMKRSDNLVFIPKHVLYSDVLNILLSDHVTYKHVTNVFLNCSQR